MMIEGRVFTFGIDSDGRPCVRVTFTFTDGAKEKIVQMTRDQFLNLDEYNRVVTQETGYHPAKPPDDSLRRIWSQAAEEAFFQIDNRN